MILETHLLYFTSQAGVSVDDQTIERFLYVIEQPSKVCLKSDHDSMVWVDLINNELV